MAINGGPYFTFNPAISFIVLFHSHDDNDAEQTLEDIWNRLSDGGKELMPLDKYPFSQKYGWIQDKFGLSWQLMLIDEKDGRSSIMPSLMFTGEQYGKGEEALHFYLSVFENVIEGNTAKYPKGMEPDQEGTIMFADFCLENQWFALMESARANDHFNEAISFLVYCDHQKEIDDY